MVSYNETAVSSRKHGLTAAGFPITRPQTRKQEPGTRLERAELQRTVELQKTATGRGIDATRPDRMNTTTPTPGPPTTATTPRKRQLSSTTNRQISYIYFEMVYPRLSRLESDLTKSSTTPVRRKHEIRSSGGMSISEKPVADVSQSFRWSTLPRHGTPAMSFQPGTTSTRSTSIAFAAHIRSQQKAKGRIIEPRSHRKRFSLLQI